MYLVLGVHMEKLLSHRARLNKAQTVNSSSDATAPGLIEPSYGQ